MLKRRFDPTRVFFLDLSRERWELAKDVILFTDLILRWRYHAIINVTRELHPDIYDGKIDADEPPLALYLCDEVIYGKDGQETLRLRPIHIATDFDPFLTHMANLVVLRRVVERLEAQNPNYTGERPLKEDENSLLLTTAENLREVALHILWARKISFSCRYKFIDIDYSMSDDFWKKVREWANVYNKFVPEPRSSLFTVTKQDVIGYSSSETTEPLAGKDIECEREYVKHQLQKFAENYPLTTDEERLIVLKAFFDAGFPRPQNKDIGEILWPDRQHVEAATLKRYGSRLCRALKEINGKSWT